MNEEQLDLVFDRYEDIYRQVHALVNELTKDLDAEADDIIRQKLSEEFRFWR